MRFLGRGLCLVLLFGGCRYCNGGPGEGRGPQHAEGTKRASAPEAEPETRPVSPPEGVRLLGEARRYGEVAISVQVHGPDHLRIRPALAIERRTASGAERIDARGITLRPRCGAEAPECIELVPGAELRPPPWKGRLGADAQCGSGAGAKAPAGEYRFVATTCEGEVRIEGAWFGLERAR